MTARTVLVLLALGCASRLTAADVDFNRDVRPILSDVCFACHGPDARVRKADLRLDTEAGLKQVRDGQALSALILARVTSKAADEVMPPPKHLKQLTPKQITTLKRWAESGANVEGHWAFQPVKRPAPPTAGHPVDAFVRAELAKQGLTPSAPADRVTLLRRLHFDLTGLPPKPEEVDVFVNDQSPDAYTKVVDRLLASPHYGERMA